MNQVGSSAPLGPIGCGRPHRGQTYQTECQRSLSATVGCVIKPMEQCSRAVSVAAAAVRQAPQRLVNLRREGFSTGPFTRIRDSYDRKSRCRLDMGESRAGKTPVERDSRDEHTQQQTHLFILWVTAIRPQKHGL